jgi:hypothetical protein
VGGWRPHTGPAFSGFLAGSLPAASWKKIHFTGITILRLNNGRIVEEVRLDDGVTALRQLGLPFNAVVEGETADLFVPSIANRDSSLVNDLEVMCLLIRQDMRRSLSGVSIDNVELKIIRLSRHSEM